MTSGQAVAALAAAMPKAGPGAGWVMAFIEILCAEYRFTLTEVILGLPLEAGLALIEARACRINPRYAIGYIERAIWRARDECRADLEKVYRIIP